VIKAADDLTDKTTAANQLWQINFTYLKING
jgi:putative transposase